MINDNLIFLINNDLIFTPGLIMERTFLILICSKIFIGKSVLVLALAQGPVEKSQFTDQTNMNLSIVSY